MKEISVIHNWRFRADRVQQAHYLAGRRYERYHRYIGAPTAVIMGIVGTAIFSNISDEPSTISTEWQMVIGFLSVAAAVLSGLQTFLGFAELGEKHRTAGARYAHLKQRLELLECFEGDDIHDKLNEIENGWAKLREDSPNLPQSVWKKIKKELTYESHSIKYQRECA